MPKKTSIPPLRRPLSNLNTLFNSSCLVVVQSILSSLGTLVLCSYLERESSIASPVTISPTTHRRMRFTKTVEAWGFQLHSVEEVTLNPRARNLPVELYFKIACDLPPSDLRSFVRVSSRLHDIGSTFLYKNISIHEENAGTVLHGLLNRLSPPCVSHVRTPPVLFVRSLVYSTESFEEDMRCLPYLCEVLQQAVNIRFLKIDTCDDTESLIVSFLRRYQISRSSVSPAAAAFEQGNILRDRSLLILPLLASFHVSSPLVLSELHRDRNIRAISVDRVTMRRDFVDLIDQIYQEPFSSRLEAFTCCLYASDVKNGLLAIVSAMPCLQYLGILVHISGQNIQSDVYDAANVGSPRF